MGFLTDIIELYLFINLTVLHCNQLVKYERKPATRTEMQSSVSVTRKSAWLTTDDFFCNHKKKIWTYICVYSTKRRKWMHFKQAPSDHSNLNSSSQPFHRFEMKQACCSLFSGYTRSKFLPSQEQQGSSPHQKLTRAMYSGGCTPNRKLHHGHKPESSCQSLGVCVASVWQHMWPLLLTWFNFNPSMDK